MSSKSSRNNAIGLSMGSLILAGLLTAAGSAKAQAVLDNYEAGTNQNLFLGYTYYYDDSKDGGNSKVNSAKPGLVAGELLYDSAKSVGEGAEGSTKSLKLDFTYGTTKPKGCAGTCPYGNMVGVGTQLVPGTDNGKVIDLTGATSISFWAKGSVSMKLRVEVTTTNITDFGFYRAEPTVTTAWAKYTFLLSSGLGGVARPAWAEAATPGLLFDLTKVQKLQFQISADDNATLTAGTLLIDNVTVDGYTWVPPSACMTCVTALTPKTGTLLADLEAVVAPPRAANQNTVGGYWYAYNDISTRVNPPPGDFSDILVGAPTDPLTGKPGFTVTPLKGAGDATGGAYIKFALGKAFTENAELIQPFVGIGTKLSDQLGTVFFNATGSTGISFDYWTEAPAAAPALKVDYVTLEVKASQSLGTNAGAVHHILLPATGGVWKTATVPWTTLVLPDWTGVLAGTLLDFTKLDQIQWAVKAAPTTTGALSVDNVRFIGTANGIVPRASKSVGGLKLSQVSGRLNMAYKLPAGVDAVDFNIMDMTGAVVASRQVGGKGTVEASMNTQALRSGLYVMQVRHGGFSASQSFTLLK